MGKKELCTRLFEFIIVYSKTGDTINVSGRCGKMMKGMKDIKENFRFLESVSTKVILVIIVLVLPLNILTIIYTNQSRNTMLEQAEEGVRKIADSYMQELESRMEISKSFLNYFLSEDADFIEMKLFPASDAPGNYQYESARSRFYYKIRSLAEMTNGADGYFYYLKNKKDSIAWASPDGQKKLAGYLDTLVEDFGRETAELGWHIADYAGEPYLLLTADETEVFYGCAIRLEQLYSSLTTGRAYGAVQVKLTDENPEESTPGDQLCVRSNAENIWAVICLSRSDILGSASLLQRILQVSSLFYLLLIPFLYGILRRFLIRPLACLVKAHREIDRGNIGYRIEERPSSGEYREVFQSFNQMAANIRELKIENYEKELDKNRMELQNLQLQIRPHFLLNTFNLIFTLAQKKEIETIQDIIMYLSDYFRYMFRSEKELELFPKELSLIRGYVEMASVSRNGRIKASFDIEPEISFVRVPPLLLHNFVENAVKHGANRRTDLHISLEGRYRNRRVIFSVRDDGNGMDSGTLRYIRSIFSGETEPESRTKRVGLYNSLRRLRYFYGEEAGISVTSAPGEGTCFEIVFPYNIEPEE